MILRFTCLRTSSRNTPLLLPDFLVPALSSPHSFRPLSSSARCRSRIGSAPLSLPQGVDLRLVEIPARRRQAVSMTEPPKAVEITGPLGKLSVKLPPYMSLNHNMKTRKASLSVLDRKQRKQREMWGTTRAYIDSHIRGVTEGHAAILRLVGVGYRATVEPSAVSAKPEYPGQQFVSLKVGYSHPIELGVPLGMKASTPQPTRILLEGVEKEVVNQFAAKLRKWRVPEPYKGKGIFVNGETIKLKAKKIK
ncbi:ribosomal protein L6, alpha-beta domain-containing protein [Usnea florida]